MAVILETRRLRLEEVELGDEAFILKLINTKGWIENIGDKGIRTIEEATKEIEEKYLKIYKEQGMGFYKMVLIEDNSPIGICGLIKRSSLKHADIGFAILPKYMGKGFTFEAASATLGYAKKELQLDTIYAITDKKNLASQKLLNRIGLELVKEIQYEDEKELILLYSN